MFASRLEPRQGEDPTKLRPLRALRALVKLMRERENTAAGAVMVMCLAGRSMERHFERFRRDPQGARLLAERPSLFDRLTDREALAGMPAGSLGRRYIEWTRQENLSAEGLRDAVQPAIAAYDALEEDRRYVADRGRDMHDLWHVATGYERDVIGESALVVFTLRQTRNTGLILPCLLGALGTRFMSREGPSVIRGAWRRSGRAAWLPAQPWEELLPLPLDAVRERLRLGPPPIYQPFSTEGVPVEANLRQTA